MVRTRDFLLYMIVLVFLLTGIVFTVLTEKSENTLTSVDTLPLTTVDGADVAAATTSTEIDRAANITSLREKIAKGDGQIYQGEPVFTSVDTPTSTGAPIGESANQDTFIAVTDRTQQYCSNQDDSKSIISGWPKAGVAFSIVEGARLIIASETNEVVVGSSTEMVTTERTLMQLPANPIRSSAVSCLNSKIIGVALDGTLIKNDETWRFRGISSESIIGYALDGFPIYGQGGDDSLLDICGGINTGSEYRYQLRAQELFVLGCFSALPNTFIE